MTFWKPNQFTPLQLAQWLNAYGTSEGVTKSWLNRERAKAKPPAYRGTAPITDAEDLRRMRLVAKTMYGLGKTHEAFKLKKLARRFLEDYTGIENEDINAYLRGGKINKLPGARPEEMTVKEIATLEWALLHDKDLGVPFGKALKMDTGSSEGLVYRGIRAGRAQQLLGDTPEELIGKVIFDRGFTSVSNDESKAAAFTGMDGAIFRIKANPKLKVLRPYFDRTEGEYILPRRGAYKITGVQRGEVKMHGLSVGFPVLYVDMERL